MSGSNSRVGSTFGHYELRKLLGKGGMGEVYEAHDIDKDRIVAIKILSEDLSNDDTYRERFRRESRVAAKLQEPHVIPIHDWGDVDGTLYIDMRLVRGVDLRKLLSNGPLAPERAVAIICQIASALDAAHADRLNHRDVKPENIIVTADDFAYLLDFGIAESRDDTRLTTLGTTIGSIAYMAPERLNGEAATHAADTYSLACVLYESLTGTAPFPAKSMPQVIVAHTSTPPPRPNNINPNVSTAFNEVIARGMAKEPDDRYATAGALGRAAQRALRHEAPANAINIAALPSSPPTTPWPPQQAPAADLTPAPNPPAWHTPQGPRQPPRRWVIPAVIASAVVVLLAVVGLTIVVVRGHSPSSVTVAGAGQGNSQISSPPTQPPPVVALPPGATPCPPVYGSAGPFTKSAVGTSMTSCPFAEEVRRAYATSGPPSSTPRHINVRSPVTHQLYPMNCAADGPLVTCDGGHDALVYLY